MSVISRHIPDIPKMKLAGLGLQKVPRQMRRRIEREMQKTAGLKIRCGSCGKHNDMIIPSLGLCMECKEKLFVTGHINKPDREVRLIGS